MTEFEINSVIVGEAIFVHRILGPGLLEEVYKQCLAYRLRDAGLGIRIEVPVPVVFEGMSMDCGYRADIIVENKVLIELKCTECLTDIHKAIVVTYLKFSNLKFGLLFNFQEFSLKNGMERICNNYY